jgi:hypothetical protein
VNRLSTYRSPPDDRPKRSSVRDVVIPALLILVLWVDKTRQISHHQGNALFGMSMLNVPLQSRKIFIDILHEYVGGAAIATQCCKSPVAFQLNGDSMRYPSCLSGEQNVDFVRSGGDVDACLQIYSQFFATAERYQRHDLLKNMPEMKLHRRFFIDLDNPAADLSGKQKPGQGDSASHSRWQLV